ncbi:MAG: T9SS C-terminal target domain-containing protein [Bacteroidetes bacterium]|nr:MAG: T9SS C-terminal target domain-containing protein [Bacteroidota bacterium]
MKKTPYLQLTMAFLGLLMLSLPVSAQQSLIHFWYFDGSIPNNLPLEELEATYTLGEETVKIEYQSALEGYPFDNEHPNWRKASMERRNAPTPINYRPVANQGLPYDASAMRGIQIKQPFSGDGGENTMIFHLPTSGYKDIVFSFAAIDEGAADALVLDYAHNDGTPQWTEAGLASTVFPLEDSYTLFTIDFSTQGNDIEEANDNPHFKIRIRFQGEDLDTDEGDRVTFNNFSLDATPLEDTNLPPFVAQPLELEKLTESLQVTTFDLNDVFTDPDDDPLTFTAVSNRPEFVQVQLDGSILSLTPLLRGDAEITLTADDGENPEVTHTFRALVYPAAFDMGQGDFVFNQWSNNQPEYTYPENMLFLQADISDPFLDYDLLYPYYIPHDDYHADDQETIGFPYNNTGRTRINGLGAGGVTFINTGRDRDLGGALVALNTAGQSKLTLSFVAGTMLQNSRLYAFRVQYRIGTEGPFSNLLVNGVPLEYVASVDGDLVSFQNIEIPQQLLGHDYVQLLWRYYLHSGDSGPRSMLRLDDIEITIPVNTDDLLQSTLQVYATNRTIYINTPELDKASVVIYNTMGQKILSKTLSGQTLHTIDASFAPGIYIVNIESGQQRFSKKVVVE